jgi:hypothetical protein
LGTAVQLYNGRGPRAEQYGHQVLTIRDWLAST